MKPRYKHIHFGGEQEPDFNNPDLSLREACRRYAQDARNAGATSLQLNFLAEPYAPLQVLYPEELYFYFSNYGAGLDYFAESEYSTGLWPRFLIEQNLQRLRCMGEAAAEFGLTGLLLLCEPRMQREELYSRFPHWRGPRVDNPSLSMTPMYALNTDLPDVRNHYRQLIAAIMKAVPGIRDVSLFSHDSGSGFAYADHLYAGSNGAFHGKRKPFASRVLEFCETIRDAGREFQPDFRVTITTSYSDRELDALMESPPDGVGVAVYGAMSWTGGLEDQWAWNDCGGGAALQARGFEASRKARVEAFRQRTEKAKRGGAPVTAMSPAPNEHYFQLKYVPNPWEQLDILALYESAGVERIFGRGYVTSVEKQPYDLNQAAFVQFVGDSSLSPTEAVSTVLGKWFPKTAKSVEKVLGDVAMAVRRRPNWNIFFERTLTYFPGPLVPDFHLLTKEEAAPFHHVVLEATRKIRGDDWWAPDLKVDDFRFIDQQYRSVVFPALEAAVVALQRLCTEVAETERQALEFQIRAIRIFLCHQTTNWNIARMIMHWRGHVIEGLEALSEVVLSEARNSLNWKALIGDSPQDWVRLTALPGGFYATHLGLPELLQRRADVMTAHACDPIRVVADEPPKATPFFKV